jgi:hypothetical protein
MGKAVRFPRKLEVFVTEEIGDGFDLLASDQLLTISDHMRQALVLYLKQWGMMTPQRQARANGAQAAE